MIKQFLTILIYHRIDPELFDNHIDFLERQFTIISLRDVLEAYSSGLGKKIPENCMVITFDDGWSSNFQLLPVLKKHNVQITIFLSVGLINTNRKLWNFVVKDIDGDENDDLKKIPNEEKDKTLLEKYGHFPEKEYEQRSMLNVREINEMKPYVDFQSHSMFHNVLPMCSEKELRDEIVESKRVLSNLLNTEIYALAYPYNRVSEREIEVARAAGYKLGRVGWRGLNDLNDNPMILKAIAINDYSSVKDLHKSIVWAQVREILHLI
jgi:peptidoglycan/xylan/chitin deacetylase (PgdA/CDA1 family)